ncbi:RAD52 family DNA repair protein [Cyanobium sp. T1B-Tous]|jgi:DNA recombination protein Rad52|uniref:RAD52 family DNA repair protein n=1 Tax=Cyanobium sp. T1B-Tous TaxID=2823721 RepID=UPI0020CDE91A|nr:RAD52 family DNA repair protein [Cyanobium sp. T1B-Tous]MCP9807666.1 RAD52 family DNA repair protein [Cyanobium sp. T1B-Tous]
MATAVFSPEQIAALSAPLDRAKVQTRSQAGRSLAYLEGWQAIAEANRIFGFDCWQRETIAVKCVSERERTLGSSNRAGWGVTYTARVRITVGDGVGAQVIREGSGAGHGIDADLGQAHESALKEAETDAMKRALMTFGNPFGLALYDKQQREVTSSAAPTPVPSANPSSRPAEVAPGRQLQSPAQPEVDPSLDPLDPGTIHQLHSTIRSLPRPALEGLTKAFRKRFQVPPDAPSIADRISQRRHRDWIETFLLQHQQVVA